MSVESEIVQEVRQRRSEISARFDHDLDKYFAYIVKQQEQHRDRLVSQLKVVSAPANQRTPWNPKGAD